MLSILSIFSFKVLILINNLSKVCCIFSRKKKNLFKIIKYKVLIYFIPLCSNNSIRFIDSNALKAVSLK